MARTPVAGKAGGGGEVPAGRWGRPCPSPEGVRRFLPVCHCSLWKGSPAAPPFVRRELEPHFALMEPGCANTGRQQARCASQGGGPDAGPGVSGLRSLHTCRQLTVLSWLGSHPGDVCLGGREAGNPTQCGGPLTRAWG